MAKRLNKKVIVGLTVAGMAVTTAAGVVMVLNLPKKDPLQFVQQAEQAKAGKPPDFKPDYKLASDFYQRAYQRATSGGAHSPEGNDYLNLAGEMALKSGDARRAIGSWQQVILNDPQHLKAQENIVKFYLELAELQGGEAWGLLQTRAEKLCQMGQQSETKNFFGLYALGRSLIAQRAIKETYAEDGKKNLIEAVNGDKGNPDYAKALAEFYLSEGEVKDAVGVYEILMANLPPESEKAAKAYLYRGQLFAMDKVAEKIPEAEQKALADLIKAVEFAPQNVDCLTGLGGYWHGKKLRAIAAKGPAADIEEFRGKAKQLYEDAIKADPDHYIGYLQLMQLYAEDGKFDDALKVAAERLQRGTNREHYLGWRDKQYKVRTLGFVFQINLAKLGAIGQTAKDAEDAKRQRQPVMDRLDEVHKEVVAETGEDEPIALLMHGRLLTLQGNPYAAIKALEKAEKLAPGTNLEIQRLLSDLYARTGSPGLAEDALKLVLSAQPADAHAWASLALISSQLQHPEEALAAAERALGLDPQNAVAIRAKMSAYEQQKNFEGLKEAQRQLSALQTSTTDKLNRALILRLQANQNENPEPAKIDESEKLLREVLATDPLNLTALRNLAGILIDDRKDNAQALELLSSSRSTAEKQLAEITATQPSSDRKSQYERLMTNIDILKIFVDPNTKEEDRVRHMEEVIKRGDDPYVVALDLFQLYQNQDRMPEAFQQLKEAHKLRPNEESIIDALFTFSLAEKDFALAEELIDKAIALGSERSGGHFYRGQLIMAKATRAEEFAPAVRELQEGLVEMPNFAEGHSLLGRAFLSMNKIEEAKQSFTEARRLNPQHVWATVGLAMVAELQQNQAEKQKYLDLSEKIAANHPWVRAELQEREDRRDPQKGISRREELRKQDPKDTENLLKLAALYAQDNKLDQAKSLYEEASQLAPKDLRVARAHALFLASKNPPEMSAATEVINRLIQSFDENSKAEKAAAQFLLAAHLDALVKMRAPEAPKREDVDAAYLAAAQFSDTPDVHAEIGNYFMQQGNNPKAEEWFRKTITAPEGKVQQSLRQRAHQYLIQTMIRSMDPTKSDALQKEINAYRANYPEDSYGILFQAEYHTAVGQDIEALKIYDEFLNKQTTSITGHYRRALAHFRRSEWEAAAKDLANVKRFSPRYSEFQPRIFLAQALRNSGQIDAAIAELQSILNEPGHPIAAIQMLFGWYMELKRFDSAASLIETRSQGNPNMPLWDELRIQLALARKDSATAIQVAQNSVEKSQFDPATMDRLFNVYLQTDHYDDLIHFVEQKLPADKHAPAVFIRLASAYAGKKENAKAVENYAKAFASPEVDLALFTYVFREDLRKRLDADAASEAISAQLQSRPDDRILTLLQAVVHHQKGDTAASITLFKELLAKTDANQVQERLFILRELAIQLYQAKNRDECRAVYQQILELEPNDAPALNNLACMLMDDFNDPKAALPYSKKVAGLAPNNGGVLDTYGWNLVLLGDYDQGIAQLGKAVELESRLAALHYHLGEAFYRRAQSSSTKNKEEDLSQAKIEIQLAHQLIMESGQDTEHVLDKVIAVGEQLGIKLDKKGLTEKPATQTAS